MKLYFGFVPNIENSQSYSHFVLINLLPKNVWQILMRLRIFNFRD